MNANEKKNFEKRLAEVAREMGLNIVKKGA